MEFRVKEPIRGLVGIPLKELKIKRNTLICSVVRKREVIIPDGETTIEVGDSVVVVSKEERFADIQDILDS